MRKLLVLLVIGMLATLVLGTAVFAVGDTFVIGSNTDARTLDAHKLHDWQEGVIAWNIYESLLVYDPTDYSIQPRLATSWGVAEDGKSVTFHLRRGVTFHDGTSFNADAVAYSWERFTGVGHTCAQYLERIKGYDVVDEYTISFYVDEPWAFLVDAFASEKTFRVVAPDYVKAHATPDDPWAQEWMAENTCGTGPYTLTKWVRGEYLEADWYEDYWRDWPEDKTFFKKIVLRNIPESGLRALMMEKGDIDYSCVIYSPHFEAMQAHPDVVAELHSGMAQQFIFFNSSKPPLDDPELRRAISYAVDYEAAAATYLKGAPIARGIFSSRVPGFNPDIPVSTQDMDLAKQIFAEAGYKPGEIKLEIVPIAGTYQLDTAVLIQENLAELGIEVTINPMPWAVYQHLRLDVETMPQMSFMYLMTTFADPLDILYRAFVPDAVFKIGYVNEVVGKLADLAATIPDSEVRWELYKRMQELVWPDHPALYMWETQYPITYRVDVKGVVPDTLYLSLKVETLWRE